MHLIALRTAPARMNGFGSIKGVNNHFHWYHSGYIALQQFTVILSLTKHALSGGRLNRTLPRKPNEPS